MNTVETFSIHRVRKYDYSTPGMYRILLETMNHEEILGELRDGKMILSADGEDVLTVLSWAMHRFPYVDVRGWTIIPHGIELCVALTEHPNYEASCIEETDEEKWRHYRRIMTIPRFVGFVKMNSARRINARHGRTGNALWTRRYKVCLIPDEAEAQALCRELNAAFIQMRYSGTDVSSADTTQLSSQRMSFLHEFFTGNASDGEVQAVTAASGAAGYETVLLGRAIFITGPMLRHGEDSDTGNSNVSFVSAESNRLVTSRLRSIGPGRIVAAVPRIE